MMAEHNNLRDLRWLAEDAQPRQEALSAGPDLLRDLRAGNLGKKMLKQGC
jgi:hypothetical protein